VEEYNPFLYEADKAMSQFTPNDILAKEVIKKSGIKTEKNVTPEHLTFAYKAGLWNGLVGTVKSIPELASLISKGIQLIFDDEFRKEFNEEYKEWKELCDNYNDSDTYVGCAWDILWERIKDAHTTGSSPQIAQQYGKSTINLVTIPIAIAKVGKISKVKDIFSAFNKLAKNPKQLAKYLGKGSFNIKKLLKNTDFKAVYDDFISGATKRKFADKLSIEEEAVFKFYTNKSYYKFNQALISGNKTDDIIEIEKLLNHALDKVPSSQGTYYRGIGKDEIEMLEKLKVGDEVTYKNFLSTSSEKEKAIDFYYSNLKRTEKGALLDIISNNGKKIDKYSDITEWEILHKSNTKFELINIDHNYIINIEDVAFEGAKPIKTIKYVLKEK